MSSNVSLRLVFWAPNLFTVSFAGPKALLQKHKEGFHVWNIDNLFNIRERVNLVLLFCVFMYRIPLSPREGVTPHGKCRVSRHT